MDKSDFRPWWGNAPRDLIAELAPALFEIGWHLSLAGSVMSKGIGRDLDLVVTPTRPTAVSVGVVLGTIIKNHDDWGCVDYYIDPDLRSMQVLVVTGDNKLIDFYIGNEPDPDIASEIWLDYEISEGWGMGC